MNNKQQTKVLKCFLSILPQKAFSNVDIRSNLVAKNFNIKPTQQKYDE